MPNSIYLLKTNAKPLYKLGWTAGNINQRIAELQTGCPYKLGYIFHIRVKNPREIEAYLHQQFDDYRLSGEWFELDGTQLSRCIALMQGIEFQSCLERAIKSNNKTENQHSAKWIFEEVETAQNAGEPTKVEQVKHRTPDTDDLLEYLRWLPPEDKLIKMLEQTPRSIAGFVRTTLKITAAGNSRRAKVSITAFLQQLGRADLLAKFNIE